MDLKAAKADLQRSRDAHRPVSLAVGLQQPGTFPTVEDAISCIEQKLRSMKTFESTKYVKLYSDAGSDFSFMEGMGMINNFVDAVAKNQGVSGSEARLFKKSLEDCFKNMKAVEVEKLAT